MNGKTGVEPPVSPKVSAAHIGRALLSIAVLAILVVGAGAFLLSYFSLHQHTEQHLQTLASFAASESGSAIEFRDFKTATEILQSIPPEVGLTAAEIRDESDVILARLDRHPEGIAGVLAGLIGAERVSHDVIVDGRRIGRVMLEGGTASTLRTLSWLLAWLLFGMLLFAVCALAVGRIYTARVTDPIHQLREIIQHLIEDRDFTQRAPPSALAEVEDLRLEFNILLDEISLRDRRLTQNNEVLRRAAYIDALTGLPNRAMFESAMQSTIDACDRQRGRACLLYLDIDAFKAINDNFGHVVGDEVLVQIAARLRTWRQHEAFAARLGGDEFVVLLAPLADYVELGAMLRELQQALELPVQAQGVVITPGVSIGTAIYPDVAGDAEDLVRRADQAMYLIKSRHHQRRRLTRWLVAGDEGGTAPTADRMSGEHRRSAARADHGDADQDTQMLAKRLFAPHQRT